MPAASPLPDASNPRRPPLAELCSALCPLAARPKPTVYPPLVPPPAARPTPLSATRAGPVACHVLLDCSTSLPGARHLHPNFDSTVHSQSTTSSTSASSEVDRTPWRRSPRSPNLSERPLLPIRAAGEDADLDCDGDDLIDTGEAGIWMTGLTATLSDSGFSAPGRQCRGWQWAAGQGRKGAQSGSGRGILTED
ncbi:hypothetical protein GGX14DRAFT_564244 [Mycena pura]|uniref:Uncharacterized protein n=1 Tax=Mycena pura TaxID=153505 RepID=A0AAD6VGK7_9AGAR|nr:hypothetical protein GGX14DRAFT_564244 [Mycena pura]